MGTVMFCHSLLAQQTQFRSTTHSTQALFPGYHMAEHCASTRTEAGEGFRFSCVASRSRFGALSWSLSSVSSWSTSCELNKSCDAGRRHCVCFCMWHIYHGICKLISMGCIAVRSLQRFHCSKLVCQRLQAAHATPTHAYDRPVACKRMVDLTTLAQAALHGQHPILPSHGPGETFSRPTGSRHIDKQHARSCLLYTSPSPRD